MSDIADTEDRQWDFDRREKMDNRNAAFENHWASQWVDFDDTDTTERRKRIAKTAFDAGWSAALTDEVQDSIRATARAEALREAVEPGTPDGYIDMVQRHIREIEAWKVRSAAILADKQEEPDGIC